MMAELRRSKRKVGLRTRTLGKGVAVACFLLVGCTPSEPEFVQNRPELEECGEGEVFLPPRQGPSGTQQQSLDALDCFVEAHEDLRPAELEFTLMGAEGQRYRAILQTLDDGTFNFFHELDEGWARAQGCQSLQLGNPPVPHAADCEITEPSSP